MISVCMHGQIRICYPIIMKPSPFHGHLKKMLLLGQLLITERTVKTCSLEKVINERKLLLIINNGFDCTIEWDI